MAYDLDSMTRRFCNAGDTFQYPSCNRGIVDCARKKIGGSKMFISSKEVETMLGLEIAVRLCEWIKGYTPVACKEVFGSENAMRFNIDEAIEHAKIKMLHDSFKREFFPHLVKLKHYKVSGVFQNARSA